MKKVIRNPRRAYVSTKAAITITFPESLSSFASMCIPALHTFAWKGADVRHVIATGKNAAASTAPWLTDSANSPVITVLNPKINHSYH